MKREIKFRAWDKEHDEMLYPDCTDEITFAITEYGVETYDMQAECNGQHLPMLSTDVMQFTGLKDMNGVEIYEGDILKSKLERGFGNAIIGVCEYKENMAGFVVTIKLDEEIQYAYFNGGATNRNTTLRYSEVIGNKYENGDILHELLYQGKSVEEVLEGLKDNGKRSK